MEDTIFPPVLQLFPIPKPGSVTSIVETGPGDIVEPAHRRHIDKTEFVWVLLNAGYPPGSQLALPGDFDRPTLEWALRNASFVALWPDLTGKGEPNWEAYRRHERSPRLVAILCDETTLAPWRKCAKRLAGPTAEIFVAWPKMQAAA